MTVQHPCISLFESLGCDEATYAELLDLFLEDAPPRVNAIREAVMAGDAATLAREAHTYKGAASVLDAREVASDAQRLEMLGREGRLDGAAAIADQLARESAMLFDSIRRYRSTFANAA